MADDRAAAWRAYELANLRARHAYRLEPLAAWAHDLGRCPICGQPPDNHTPDCHQPTRTAADSVGACYGF
jgi:hypothetical protein